MLQQLQAVNAVVVQDLLVQDLLVHPEHTIIFIAFFLLACWHVSLYQLCYLICGANRIIWTIMMHVLIYSAAADENLHSAHRAPNIFWLPLPEMLTSAAFVSLSVAVLAVPVTLREEGF